MKNGCNKLQLNPEFIVFLHSHFITITTTHLPFVSSAPFIQHTIRITPGRYRLRAYEAFAKTENSLTHRSLPLSWVLHCMRTAVGWDIYWGGERDFFWGGRGRVDKRGLFILRAACYCAVPPATEFLTQENTGVGKGREKEIRPIIHTNSGAWRWLAARRASKQPANCSS